METKLSKRVEAVKAKYDISDKELAKALGVSYRTVEGWRQGRSISRVCDKLLTILEDEKVALDKLTA